MMSDEEREGEKWLRHCPAYRSDLFNKFGDKLNSHAVSVNRAHFPRDVGSPRQAGIPSSVK